MNKFMKVLNDVHEFIVGGVETQPEKTQIGFSAEKPKRKYTRRKKTSVKKTTRSKRRK
tara:strand:- start:30 stop:203 length:174 start_codon:yes stop_codon:yes gene_type:complete